MAMENWLSDQIRFNAKEWSRAISIHYPQHLDSWRDSESHLYSLRNEWNYLESIQELEWENILKARDLTVLDIGCGTGWLSALISQFDEVKSIIALDSDGDLLEKMLPDVVLGLGGNLNKIRPIQGLFSPILLDDESMDIICGSSAFHHSADLYGLLRECKRVLKPGGRLLILNETPSSAFQWRIIVLKKVLRFLTSSFTKSGGEFEQQLSRTSLLYDPFLGDLASPIWHWDKALHETGFRYEKIKTSSPTYKNRPDKSRLTHFVCSSL